MKKRIISLFLALILLFRVGPVFATDTIIEDTDPLEIESKQPLTEEEQKAIREKELKALWEAEVNRYIDRTTDQLTTTYLVGDFESGTILEEKNIDELVAIASTTKILTIYVVLDQIKAGNISKDDIITVDRQTDLIGGSSYDLVEGEEVTVDELIKAAMIVSGNDAVNALGKHVAGTEEDFLKLMRQKLEELGITKYQIINTSGLPNYNINKQNMLSTRSLFILTRNFLLDYPEILEITSMPALVSAKRNYDEKNTNPILGELPEIDGLKTGYTGMAGRCMVATGLIKALNNDKKDMRLIGITMGSESDGARYVAIKKLMEKAFKTYTTQILGHPNTPVDTIVDEKLDPEEINVYPKETKTIIRKNDDFVNSTVNLGQILPETNAGAKVGDITYYLNGEEVFKTDLIVKQNIIESSLLRKVQILYRNFYMSVYKMFNE